MAKYTLYFKMDNPERINDTKFCHYYLRFVDNATETTLYETKTTYTPVSLCPQDMNDWRASVGQAARMRVKKELGLTQDIKVVCLNDTSMFLTKYEKTKKTRLGTRNSDTGSGERLYTVAQVNGVWTIKKVETQLLSEEEAKTLLFQKIVNGED